MGKLGVYFGTEKQAALLRGDTSNAVINRYFVYGFQAIGMYFCGTPDGSPAMVHLQARYAQKAWESLIEISRTGDQKLRAQGLLLFVHAIIRACSHCYGAHENRSFLPIEGVRDHQQMGPQVHPDGRMLPRTIGASLRGRCGTLSSDISGELFLLSAGWVGAGNDCKDRKGVSAGPPGENHPTIFRYRTQSEFRNSV